MASNNFPFSLKPTGILFGPLILLRGSPRISQHYGTQGLKEGTIVPRDLRRALWYRGVLGEHLSTMVLRGFRKALWLRGV